MSEKKFKWTRIAVEKAKVLAGLRYSGAEVAAVIGTTRMSCLSRANRLKEFSFTGRLRGGVHNEEIFRARVNAASMACAHVTEEWIAAQDLLRARETMKKPPQPKASTSAKPRLLGLPETITPEMRMEKEFVNLNRVRFLEKPAKPIEIVDAGITIHDLTDRSCRWILGDLNGENTRYCGERNRGLHKGGSSYCEHHEAMAWPKKRKKQSTEPEASTEVKSSFLPKRNSNAISSLNYSSGQEKSKV